MEKFPGKGRKFFALRPFLPYNIKHTGSTKDIDRAAEPFSGWWKGREALEKRRIRLEINGVVCGLITEESEEYMQALANEVGELMREILDASPFITREAAALTAALGYCDDAKKNGKKANEFSERAEELEVEAEIWQEDKEKLLAKAGEEAKKQIEALSEENTALKEAAVQAAAREERLQIALKEQETLRRELEEALSSREVPQREADPVDREEIERLQKELAGLREQLKEREGSPEGAKEQEPRTVSGNPVKLRNPLRHPEMEEEGLRSFFEKKK